MFIGNLYGSVPQLSFAEICLLHADVEFVVVFQSRTMLTRWFYDSYTGNYFNTGIIIALCDVFVFISSFVQLSVKIYVTKLSDDCSMKR